MSLITRCPACTTVFKVVPDQLRVSEGWVRCGQCDEVFDANAHLQTSFPADLGTATLEEPDEPTASIEQPAEVTPTYDWRGIETPEVTNEPVADSDLQTAVDAHDQEKIGDQQPFVSPEFGDQVVQPIDSQAPLVAEADFDPVFATSPGADHAADLNPDPVIPAVDPKLVQPAFMRYAGGSHADAPQKFRWVWNAMAIVLAALLPMQWVVQERDRLAASVPGLTPILEVLCVPVGCKIAPMQSIEAVVIDSSAFTKLQPDVYQLTFSIKSSALVEIATPSLELTLTDMQDQPLVRRVFAPGDLGRPDQNLGVGAEWGGSRVVALPATPVTSKITGYRLLAFYQ